MVAKFAYLSSANPKDDFMFTIEVEGEEQANNYAVSVNATLSDAKIELVSVELQKRRKHGVSLD